MRKAGITMFVISKDRDKCVEIERVEALNAFANVQDGMLFGFNVQYANEILGDYDTLDEANNEITRILLCDYPYYVMSGFTDYEGSFYDE